MLKFVRTIAVLTLLGAGHLLAPSEAHALKLFGWLDELSGPGPFRGAVFTGEIVCLGAWNPGSDPEPAYRQAELQEAADKISMALPAIKALRDEVIKNEPGASLAALKLGTLIAPDSLVTPEELALAVNVQKLVTLAAQPEVNKSELIVVMESLAEAARAARSGIANEQVRRDKEIAQQRWCYLDRSNALASVQFEYGTWDDDETRQTYVGDTKLTSILVLMYVPLPRIWTWGRDAVLAPGLRAIDVGTGFGAYRLSGTTIRDVNLWRGVVPVRARIMPSEFIFSLLPGYKHRTIRSPSDMPKFGVTRRYLQSLRAFVGHEWVVSDIDPRAFAPDAAPTNRRDRLFTWGVEVDLGLVLRGAFKK